MKQRAENRDVDSWRINNLKAARAAYNPGKAGYSRSKSCYFSNLLLRNSVYPSVQSLLSLYREIEKTMMVFSRQLKQLRSTEI